MSLAVGGNFESLGPLLRQILLDAGLRPEHYLIDVGCGSGRLACVVDVARYLGTDVVPELLDYARHKCRKSAWSFQLVEDIVIPESDAQADIVCFFSVFTHLLHEDSYRYLLEAARVLKSGGIIVCSFLEFKVYPTWTVFEAMVDARRKGISKQHDQFISADAINAWAHHAGLEVGQMFGGDVPHFRISEPVRMDDGRIVEGQTPFGQSVCVLRKP